MLWFNGSPVVDRNTAAGYLQQNLDLDQFDIEDLFKTITKESEYRISVLADENTYQEQHIDGLYSVLNEICNLCDDRLRQPRLSKSRETFEAIRNLIEQVM